MLWGRGGPRGEQQEECRHRIGVGARQLGAGVCRQQRRVLGGVDDDDRNVGREERRPVGVGDHQTTTRVADVAAQLGATAGRVDADEGDTGERRATGEEQVLGNVLE